MRLTTAVAMAAVSIFVSAGTAGAQSWTGMYVGGSIGAAMQGDDASETVRFDTNLDGTFDDTVRTITGADAFSPGFCGGLAVNSLPAGGCTDDEDGVDVGGRVGYDWQMGRIVFGGVFDVSRADVTDSVTAFSTTPAFYSFTRDLKVMTGLRGRLGFGTDRLLVYGTGGAAWGRVDHSFTTSNAANTFVSTSGNDGSSQGTWGYQAGGGVEVRLRMKWSVTGEYLFTSLDDRDDAAIRSMGPAPATNPFILVNAAGTDLRRAESFEFQAIRVGLNYRF